ncbi:hypothetical protein ACQP3F_26015, partial [Escherichia coli]
GQDIRQEVDEQVMVKVPVPTGDAAASGNKLSCARSVSLPSTASLGSGEERESGLGTLPVPAARWRALLFWNHM